MRGCDGFAAKCDRGKGEACSCSSWSRPQSRSPGLSGAAHSATRISVGACGSVLLPGTSWLGGDGVDVRSNGVDQGTAKECSKSLSMVGGVAAGERWQCVELVNRLYLTRGWISSAVER